MEIVSARNLESRQSIDAYFLARFVKHQRKEVEGEVIRSCTIPSNTHPTWNHCLVLELPSASCHQRKLLVHILNENNFFFDMFPSALNEEMKEVVGQVEEEIEIDANVRATTETPDEVLGMFEISISSLCNPLNPATDEWYLLRGTQSGEIRIRTAYVEEKQEQIDQQQQDQDQVADMEKDGNGRYQLEQLLEKHLYCQLKMVDHYGFPIPEQAAKEWCHLKSYQRCREKRRIEEWERLFGSESHLLLNKNSSKENSTVRRLIRTGIPSHLRERVYMNISGAREKKEAAPNGYYQNLIEQASSLETITFRQIELDINRTFGHTDTRISTEEGRSMLRRILRAYSLRNPTIGYCQGLNFIVGFLMLLMEEESTFWLLAVLCEDMYPGYYTSTMSETQTDMLVLKNLIAERLPELDEFTADVGLPLELLGSQWLLCLFTTTFPSETVFRIFDCLFAEGNYFVFPVIMAHLRHVEPILLALTDFQSVLDQMKVEENMVFDGDAFMLRVLTEMEAISMSKVESLRELHRLSVQDEMQRAARARAFNRQLAIVYQIPAFSNYAANLLRYFHEGAEVSTRTDVAFLLTLLCHGLVWLAENSKRFNNKK